MIFAIADRKLCRERGRSSQFTFSKAVVHMQGMCAQRSGYKALLAHCCEQAIEGQSNAAISRAALTKAIF